MYKRQIQQDHEDLVLTDLESTNGSKVNNEEVQLRILRFGDLITIGRSTLIFGTRVEINERLERLSGSSKVDGRDGGSKDGSKHSSEKVAVQDDWQDDPNYQLSLLDLDPPKLPERMSPGQAAQLSELIEFLHMHLRQVVSDVDLDHRKKKVELTPKQWQKILDAQSRLAEYLRKISNPT